MYDTFISYSRADNPFPTQLADALSQADHLNQPDQKVVVWFDRNNIEPASDFRDRIRLGIEQSRTVTVIFSESYIASEICYLELSYAQELRKPIIPLIISDHIDRERVAGLQAKRETDRGEWKTRSRELSVELFDQIYNQKNFILAHTMPLEKCLALCMQAIFSDIDYSDGLRKWSNRYLEWTQQGEIKSKLLVRKDLEDAEFWRDRALENQISIDSSLLHYIRQSRQEKMRADRTRTSVITAASIAFAIIAFIAISLFFESNTNLEMANIRGTEARNQESTAIFSAHMAQTEAVRADNNAGTAIANAEISESQRLAALAGVILDNPSGNAEMASLLAIHGLNQRFTVQADFQLSRALSRINVLASVAGRGIGYLSQTNTVILLQSNRLVFRNFLDGTTFLEIDTGLETVDRVFISPDENMIAVEGYANPGERLAIWSTNSGEMLYELAPQEGTIGRLSFSPDSQKFLIGIVDDGRMPDETMYHHQVVLLDFSENIREQIIPFDIVDQFPRVSVSMHGFANNGRQMLVSRDTYGGNVVAMGFGSGVQLSSTEFLWLDTQTLKVTQQQVYAVSACDNFQLSPQATLTFVRSCDGSTQIRDNLNGTAFDLTQNSSTGAAFSEDENYFALISGSVIRIWSIQAQSLIQEWDIVAPVTHYVFAASDPLFATVDLSNRLTIWNYQTGEMLQQTTIDRQPFRLEFSDESRDMIVYTSQAAAIYPINSTREPIRLTGQTGVISDVIIVDDHIISLGEQESRLWSFQSRLRQIASDVSASDFWVADSHGHMITIDEDEVLISDWQTQQIQHRLELERYPSHAAISPDGWILAVTGVQDNQAWLSVWDIEQGYPLFYTEWFSESGTLPYRTNAPVKAVFSPNSNVIAALSLDGVIRIWDVVTYELLATLDNQPYVGLYWQPDSAGLAAVRWSGGVEYWDKQSGLITRTFDGFGVSVVAPDGRYTFTGLPPGFEMVYIWELATGNKIALQNADAGSANPVFSPNGDLFAVQRGETLLIAQTSDGTTRREIAHPETIAMMEFSPDSRYLVTTDNQQTWLWDLATGSRIYTFENTRLVEDAAHFSPDSTKMMLIQGSVAPDVRLIVFSIEQMQIIRSIQPGLRQEFSPDSQYIFADTGDAIVIWDIDHEQLMQFACSVLLRDVTPQEQAGYDLVDEPICASNG